MALWLLQDSTSGNSFINATIPVSRESVTSDTTLSPAYKQTPRTCPWVCPHRKLSLTHIYKIFLRMESTLTYFRFILRSLRYKAFQKLFVFKDLLKNKTNLLFLIVVTKVITMLNIYYNNWLYQIFTLCENKRFIGAL